MLHLCQTHNPTARPRWPGEGDDTSGAQWPRCPPRTASTTPGGSRGCTQTKCPVPRSVQTLAQSLITISLARNIQHTHVKYKYIHTHTELLRQARLFISPARRPADSALIGPPCEASDAVAKAKMLSAPLPSPGARAIGLEAQPPPCTGPMAVAHLAVLFAFYLERRLLSWRLTAVGESFPVTYLDHAIAWLAADSCVQDHALRRYLGL